MNIGPYRFDRLEFAGSLGDLGTLVPLATAMILINGLSATSVLLMVGLFYIFSGLYYRLPIPVQPLKVVAAIAIAYPQTISVSTIAASGILFGGILLLLALTGLIDRLARFFTKPIMRGIQLGLGFLLLAKGIGFVIKPELFIGVTSSDLALFGLPINPVIGVFGFLVTLLLLSSKRFPAALVLVTAGVVFGSLLGSFGGGSFSLGPAPMGFEKPGWSDFYNALFLLVIPQIPLTLGNAVMGTADTCLILFGDGPATRRAGYRAFALSMAFANLLAGCMGAMPMCHGAGGLAAHHRFGARTGGSNLMIGALFVCVALFFGKAGILLLSSIPNAVLGILLMFAGIELALFVRDLETRNDLFVALLIAGTGFATTNMGIAFFTGIIVIRLMKWKKISV